MFETESRGKKEKAPKKINGTSCQDASKSNEVLRLVKINENSDWHLLLCSPNLVINK